MELSIKPIKKFITSLYYANKKLEYAPKKRFSMGEEISPEFAAKISPYLEGYEQLAGKYNLDLHANTENGKKYINVNNGLTRTLNIEENLTPPEIARKVYQAVSESLK